MGHHKEVTLKIKKLARLRRVSRLEQQIRLLKAGGRFQCLSDVDDSDPAGSASGPTIVSAAGAASVIISSIHTGARSARCARARAYGR